MKYQPQMNYMYRGVIENRCKSIVNDATKSISNYRMMTSKCGPSAEITHVYNYPNLELDEEITVDWLMTSQTCTDTDVILSFGVDSSSTIPHSSGILEQIGSVIDWRPA